jgi:hypothetical protein
LLLLMIGNSISLFLITMGKDNDSLPFIEPY